jgi:hypothetical protein
MKKVILFLMLVLVINTTFAQEAPEQFRRVYSEVVCVKKKTKPIRREAENTVFFNYGNEAVIKIYMADGTVRYYDQITDREEGSTDGGMAYSSAIYKERGKTLEIYIQLFEDRKYGFRIIFSNGDIIQFLE